jgi:hypothetical protein
MKHRLMIAVAIVALSGAVDATTLRWASPAIRRRRIRIRRTKA